jgi:hypothetical protein
MKQALAVVVAIFISNTVMAQTLPLPAGYWGFDYWRNTEDLGCAQSRAFDASPGRNCAVLRDGALCVPPIVWSGHYDNTDNPLGGRAGFFDGEDSIAEIPHDPKRNLFTDQLTVSAWVKPGRLAGIQAIVRKWYAMDSYSLALVGNRYVFTVAFPGGPWGVTVDVWADEPAVVDRWTHVAGVFDGQNRTACIYLDGGAPTCVAGTQPTLQGSQRPVTLGNHPAWDPFQGLVDEVRMYRAVLDQNQIRFLAGRANLFFGGDTNVEPSRSEFPAGKSTYDFYMGSLGWPRWDCRIADLYGRDVKDGSPVPDEMKCPFSFDAATEASPKKTYAFYWVQGPGRAQSGQEPLAWGQEQASHFLERWELYRDIIGGQTLFADVETERDGGRAGWRVCTSSDPKACSDNRKVLEGFLQKLADERVPWPGVYTSPEVWVDFFGKDFLPRTRELDPFEPSAPIPFVLWIASCSDRCESVRPPEQVRASFPTIMETVLGGMRAVIWQYQSKQSGCAPDYDVSLQDPEKGFFPLWAFDINGRRLRFSCTCGFLPYGYCRQRETCVAPAP